LYPVRPKWYQTKMVAVVLDQTSAQHSISNWELGMP